MPTLFDDLPDVTAAPTAATPSTGLFNDLPDVEHQTAPAAKGIFDDLPDAPKQSLLNPGNDARIVARTIGGGLAAAAQGVLESDPAAKYMALPYEQLNSLASTLQAKANSLKANGKTQTEYGPKGGIERARLIAARGGTPESVVTSQGDPELDDTIAQLTQVQRAQALKDTMSDPRPYKAALAPDALAETYGTNPSLESGKEAMAARITGNVAGLFGQGVVGSAFGMPLLPAVTMTAQASADARNAAEAKFRQDFPNANEADVRAEGDAAAEHAGKVAAASGALFAGLGPVANGVAKAVLPSTMGPIARALAVTGIHSAGNVAASAAVRAGDALSQGKSPAAAAQEALTGGGIEGLSTDLAFGLSGLPGHIQDYRSAQSVLNGTHPEAGRIAMIAMDSQTPPDVRQKAKAALDAMTRQAQKVIGMKPADLLPDPSALASVNMPLTAQAIAAVKAKADEPNYDAETKAAIDALNASLNPPAENPAESQPTPGVAPQFNPAGEPFILRMNPDGAVKDVSRTPAPPVTAPQPVPEATAAPESISPPLEAEAQLSAPQVIEYPSQAKPVPADHKHAVGAIHDLLADNGEPPQRHVQVVADADGDILEAFTDPAVAEQHIRNDAARGEWLWTVDTDTGEAKLHGGLPERRANAKVEPSGAFGKSHHFEGETLAQAGELPRKTPFGVPYAGDEGSVRLYGESTGPRWIAATPNDIGPSKEVPGADVVRPAVPRPSAPESEQLPPEAPASGGSQSLAQGLPIVEAPIDQLTLSKDVPQFKNGANSKGVVEPLAGKFDRTGVAPIQLWRRKNGNLEVISGRHRLDLARRSGETTIPAQIHDEAAGFDQRDAARLDAELNIRDGQGSVQDYASYFKHSQISQEDADARGLLARAKGKAGFTIGNAASEDTFAAHNAGRISDSAALAIATAAPGDAAAQSVGLRAALDGKSADFVGNLIKAAQMRAAERASAGQQVDLFGFDDSAIRQMEAQAKRAAEEQRAIREQIRAVEGASKKPEVAKRLGVDVKDPAGVQRKVAELRAELAKWDKWPMHADLLARTRGEYAGKSGAPASDLFAGRSDSPFNLTGESAAERTAREQREAKEADARQKAQAEADKAESDRHQGSLFETPASSDQERQRLSGLMSSHLAANGHEGAPPVHVFDSPDQVPDALGGPEVRKSVSEGSQVEAFYVVAPDGKSHIVLLRDGAQSEADRRGITLEHRVQQLASHEIVHDAGSLSALLPGVVASREYHAVVDGVIARLKPEEQTSLARLYGLDLRTPRDRAELAEEILGRFNEGGHKPPTWVQSAIAKIRALLRRYVPLSAVQNLELFGGRVSDWTDADVISLLNTARNKANAARLEGGDRAGTRFAFGDRPNAPLSDHSLHDAYKKAVGESGFSDVPISRLAELAGIPESMRGAFHNRLMDLRREGNADLAHGDFSLSDNARKAWAITAPGDDYPSTLVRMRGEPQEWAANRASKPRVRPLAPTQSTRLLQAEDGRVLRFSKALSPDEENHLVPSVSVSKADAPTARGSELKQSLLEQFRGEHRNAYTGWEIGVSEKGTKHVVNQINEAGRPLLPVLDKLIQNAVWLGRRPGRPTDNVRWQHMFYAPTLIDGKPTIARLLVNETLGGEKLIDLKGLDVAKPPGPKGFIASADNASSPVGGFTPTIAQLHDAVKQLWPADPIALEKPQNERRGIRFSLQPGQNRSQIGGQPGIGHKYDVRNLVNATANIQTGEFNGRDKPTPERTEQAWKLIEDWTNPETSGAVAARLNRLAGNDIGAALAQNELLHYAVNVAQDDGGKMLRHLMGSVNLFDTGAAGMSSAGAQLRARAESQHPLWQAYSEVYKASDAATARILAGKGNEAGGLQTLKDLRTALEGVKLSPEEVLQGLSELKGTGGDDLGTTIQRLVAQQSGAHAAELDNPMLTAMVNIARHAYENGLNFNFTTSNEPLSKEAVDALRPPLANIRAKLEQSGANKLERDWWMLLHGPRNEDGPLATADKAVDGQLRSILRESMESLGLIKKGEAAKLTDAEKLATVLGKGELRKGKVQRVDKMVRAELDRRMDAELARAGDDESQKDAIEAKYTMLRDGWDAAMSNMLDMPASNALLSRMLHGEVKAAGVKWNDVFDRGNLDELKKQAVDGVLAKVEAASSKGTEASPKFGAGAHMDELRTALESQFDSIAATRRNRYEMTQIEARARDALRLTAKPEQAAERIAAEYARAQSDTPDLRDNRQSSEIRKAFNAQITNPEPVDVFAAKLGALQVSESTARKLANIAARESAARDAVARARQAEQPDRSAQSVIDSLAKSQSDTQAWPEPKRDAVREIVRKELQQIPPDLGRKGTWTSQLTAKLTGAGVSNAVAEKLAGIVWREHENRAAYREMKQTQVAAERGSLKPLVDQILSAPISKQGSPDWIRNAAAEYFRGAGLSREQADFAAVAFARQFEKRLADARESAARSIIQASAPWQSRFDKANGTTRAAMKTDVEKIVAAVRAGVTDPTRSFSDELAAANGWKGFSEADNKRLAQLDAVMSHPDTGAHEAVKAQNEMLRIVARAKMPPEWRSAIVATYRNTLLSGLPTLSLHIFQPFGSLFQNAYVDMNRAVLEPWRIPAMIQALRRAITSYGPEFRWALKNDAYTSDLEGRLQHLSPLARQLEIGAQEFRDGKLSSALPKLIFGSVDYVRRMLSSLTEAGMSMRAEYARTMFGAEALKRSGYSIADVHRLIEAGNAVKERAYDDAIAAGKSPLDAKVAALDALREAFTEGLAQKVGAKQAGLVETAARREADISVGRDAEHLQDGFLSNMGPNQFLSALSRWRNNPESPWQAKIASYLAFGIVHTPYRILRAGASFSPYGIVRYAIHRNQIRDGGASSFEQSMGTHYQERLMLAKSLAGTMLSAGLLSLFKPTKKDGTDDKEGNYLHVTGAGPDSSDKVYQDAWRKRHSPFAIEGKLFGQEFRFNYGKGLAEPFLFPLSTVGAYDDHLLRLGQNAGKANPRSISDVVELASEYLGTLQQRGAFIGLKNAGDLFSRVSNGRPATIASVATGTAANAIPWNRFFQTSGKFFMDLPDKSSVRAAIIANLPVVPAFESKPALNGLGDPLGDDTIAGKSWFAGAPVVMRIPQTGQNKLVYDLIRQKQQGPPTPVRSNIERIYGPLSDAQWYNFVKGTGQAVKMRIAMDAPELSFDPPADFAKKTATYAREAQQTQAEVMGLFKKERSLPSQ